MKNSLLFQKLKEYLNKVANLNDPRLKELSAIKTFTGRIDFCNKTFPRIKAGSGRVAYDYDGNNVLKLAKNEKGLQQNRTEGDMSIQSSYGDLVTKVLDSDNHDVWVIAEKATRCSPSEFKKFTGVDIKNLGYYLRKKLEPRQRSMFAIQDEPALDENEFVQELLCMMADYSMPAGDIQRIASWGKVRDRVVLIDYGLTNFIYETYYQK